MEAGRNRGLCRDGILRHSACCLRDMLPPFACAGAENLTACNPYSRARAAGRGGGDCGVLQPQIRRGNRQGGAEIRCGRVRRKRGANAPRKKFTDLLYNADRRRRGAYRKRLQGKDNFRFLGFGKAVVYEKSISACRNRKQTLRDLYKAFKAGLEVFGSELLRQGKIGVHYQGRTARQKGV